MPKAPDKTSFIDTFAPPIALLVKLGSVIVHVDEYTGGKGHPHDLEAIKSLLGDRDVQAWLASMDAKGFLPIRRDGFRYKEPSGLQEF